MYLAPILNINIFFLIYREMETKEMLSRRRFQRHRIIFGSGDVRADYSDCRSASHLRHGRPDHATSLAIHAAIREKNRRLVTSKLKCRCTLYRNLDSIPKTCFVLCRNAPSPYRALARIFDGILH